MKILTYLLNFKVNSDSYFAYFSDLLQSDECTLTGDITPTYGKLPEEALVGIRHEFAAAAKRRWRVFSMCWRDGWIATSTLMRRCSTMTNTWHAGSAMPQ